MEKKQDGIQAEITKKLNSIENKLEKIKEHVKNLKALDRIQRDIQPTKTEIRIKNSKIISRGKEKPLKLAD